MSDAPVSKSRPQAGTAHAEHTIREAMGIITDTHQGVLPVLSKSGKLIGIVTDGDIRRGLLNGADFDAHLGAVMNPHPVIASSEAEPHEIDALIRQRGVICVPVVDAGHRFVRLAYLERHVIPNCIPSVEGREQSYVTEAISEGWLAVGPFIERFEREVASFAGARNAVALVNGTAALHLALKVAGVSIGDLVPMPTMTFAATANAVRYCGADPVFFDSDPVSWCIDIVQLGRFLDEGCKMRDGSLVEKRTERRIGALLPVHLYGHPVDLDPLAELAERYDLPLVEDGAEALGARYKSKRLIGAESQFFVLSFNGNKVITSAGGGMILTNDDEIARRLRYLASQAKLDSREFVHGEAGYNYRMPNLNAALGLAQAEQLPKFLERKRRFVERYDEILSDVDGVRMWREAPWAESSYWMAIAMLDSKHADKLQKLAWYLPTRGIEARPVWTPLHSQTPFRNALAMDAPIAEKLHRTSLCLPCSAGLSDSDLEFTARTIVDFFRPFG